jgi:D-alanyl-D-alanine carboxypeptidase (penicillin-binding protein 5/6)
MGAPTEGARDADTLSLLRYGFSLYRRVTPVRGGERLGAARVRHADGRVPLVAARGIAATVRRGQAVDVRLDAPRSVAAPVGRGDRIGRAVVAVDDRFVGSTPVLAARAVSQAGGKSPLSRVDDAIPGPRAVLWILVAAAATIVIGIAIVATRHGEQGESN